jgi:hypothetical protein
MTAKEIREFYFQKYEQNKEAIDLRIQKGIEENRKGNCRIRFTDESGNPYVNQNVKITQARNWILKGELA